MFQDFRSGDVTIFIDMAYHENRDTLGFAQLHHGHGAVFDLRDTSGRRIVFFVVEGLNGVYDQNIGLHLFCCFYNIRQSGFGKDKQVFRGYSQPFRPELQLAFAFFAGYIKNTMAAAKAVADLQKQCRFANTGSTADQNQGAGYCAAAQDPVKLTHAGRKADLSVTFYFPDPLRLSAITYGGRFCFSDSYRLFDMFFHRVKGTAAGTAAHPFGGLVTTVGAEKNSLCLSHWISPFVCCFYYSNS